MYEATELTFNLIELIPTEAPGTYTEKLCCSGFKVEDLREYAFKHREHFPKAVFAFRPYLPGEMVPMA